MDVMEGRKIKKIANKRILMAVFAVLLVISGVLIGTAFSKKDVVARVDGETITTDDLYNVLVKQYGSTVLDSLIDNKIVEIKAKKKNVKITDDEIDEEMQSYIESNGGEEYFNSLLDQYGLTRADVELDVVNYLRIVKLFESDINITENAMKTYFEENKESFNAPEQVQASHILLDDEKTAKTVAEKLAKGADFATLAKEYSTDSSTAENGGELGYFAKGEMAEEFENTVFSMNVGGISEPVKTEFGYHIIHVTDKKEAKEAKYSEHKKEVKQILFDEAVQTKYDEWISKQREELEIKNMLTDSKE